MSIHIRHIHIGLFTRIQNVKVVLVRDVNGAAVPGEDGDFGGGEVEWTLGGEFGSEKFGGTGFEC